MDDGLDMRVNVTSQFGGDADGNPGFYCAVALSKGPCAMKHSRS